VKSFKQFVLEVKRGDDRALKLHSYLVKRSDRDGPHPMGPGYLPMKLHKDLKAHKREFEKVASKAMNKHRDISKLWNKKNSSLENLDIKTVHQTQGWIGIRNREDYDRTKNNEDPINVFRWKGQHYVIDGHHRWHRHRLTGKTHIQGRVHNLDTTE
jgi:hypothetical protein